jgi:anti-sigma-K factor RskA
MTENIRADDPDRLGYQLGAHDEREAEEFEALAASTLGESLASVAPRPELKAELMAQLDDAPHTVPLVDPTPNVAAGSAVPSSAQARANQRWWRRPALIVAAAAAAVALFVGGAAVGALTQAPATQSAQGSLESLVGAPDAQHGSATLASGHGSVAVVASASLGKAAIVLTGAPASPSGKTYELWLIRGDTPIAAGTFDVSGSATSAETLKGTYHSGDVVALTVEPAGGSTKPTSEPLFAVKA